MNAVEHIERIALAANPERMADWSERDPVNDKDALYLLNADRLNDFENSANLVEFLFGSLEMTDQQPPDGSAENERARLAAAAALESERSEWGDAFDELMEAADDKPLGRSRRRAGLEMVSRRRRQLKDRRISVSDLLHRRRAATIIPACHSA